jgi:hypothetical protein
MEGSCRYIKEEVADSQQGWCWKGMSQNIKALTISWGWRIMQWFFKLWHCSVVAGYQHYGGTYCRRLQDRIDLKVEHTSSSESHTPIYRKIRSQNPEKYNTLWNVWKSLPIGQTLWNDLCNWNGYNKTNLEHQDFPDWFIEHTALARDLAK